MVRPDRRKLAETPPRGWVGGGEVKIGTIVVATELKVLIDVVQNVMCGGHGVGFKDE